MTAVLMCLALAGDGCAGVLLIRALRRTNRELREPRPGALRVAWNARFAEVPGTPAPVAPAATQPHGDALTRRWAAAEAEAIRERAVDRSGVASQAG